MKKMVASNNVALIGFYKTLLEDNGIETIIKNYYLTSGTGDLPPQDVVPELWIIDDEKLSAAKALLRVEKGEPWVSQCGEKIDGQFGQCWKCGDLRR